MDADGGEKGCNDEWEERVADYADALGKGAIPLSALPLHLVGKGGGGERERRLTCFRPEA